MIESFSFLIFDFFENGGAIGLILMKILKFFGILKFVDLCYSIHIIFIISYLLFHPVANDIDPFQIYPQRTIFKLEINQEVGEPKRLKFHFIAILVDNCGISRCFTNHFCYSKSMKKKGIFSFHLRLYF